MSKSICIIWIGFADQHSKDTFFLPLNNLNLSFQGKRILFHMKLKMNAVVADMSPWDTYPNLSELDYYYWCELPCK